MRVSRGYCTTLCAVRGSACFLILEPCTWTWELLRTVAITCGPRVLAEAMERGREIKVAYQRGIYKRWLRRGVAVCYCEPVPLFLIVESVYAPCSTL